MNKMKRKSIGLYVRVSTLAQDIDGFSINAQITQLKQYCSFQGYKVVDVYADRGISGKSMNRPELQRMLKDYTDKMLNSLVCLKI